MFKLIHIIFGHVLTVNSRCYGRFYVKRPLFHTYVGVNSARSFQNVFNKSSRVLNLVFFKKSEFFVIFSPIPAKFFFCDSLEVVTLFPDLVECLIIAVFPKNGCAFD